MAHRVQVSAARKTEYFKSRRSRAEGGSVVFAAAAVRVCLRGPFYQSRACVSPVLLCVVHVVKQGSRKSIFISVLCRN